MNLSIKMMSPRDVSSALSRVPSVSLVGSNGFNLIPLFLFFSSC